MSVFYNRHSTDVTLNKATVSIYGFRLHCKVATKIITTLVHGECVNILMSYCKVHYLVECLGHSAFILEFYKKKKKNFIDLVIGQ